MKIFASTLQSALYLAAEESEKAQGFVSGQTQTWRDALEEIKAGGLIQIDYSSRFDKSGSQTDRPSDEQRTDLTVEQLERQFMDGTMHPKACFQLIRLLVQKTRDQAVALTEARALIAEMLLELKSIGERVEKL